MATPGNNIVLKGIPLLKDAFVVIIKTEWNNEIVDELENGCRRILEEAGVVYKTITVPGAVEIPFTINAYANNFPGSSSAFIALGCVIQGDTPHFDYVCKFITEGILNLNLKLDVPVVFGVLTLNNLQQALERIGGIHGHKGEEAAITALKMIEVNRGL